MYSSSVPILSYGLRDQRTYLMPPWLITKLDCASFHYEANVPA
jgi:hypothetical protein